MILSLKWEGTFSFQNNNKQGVMIMGFLDRILKAAKEQAEEKRSSAIKSGRMKETDRIKGEDSL